MKYNYWKSNFISLLHLYMYYMLESRDSNIFWAFMAHDKKNLILYLKKFSDAVLGHIL